MQCIIVHIFINSPKKESDKNIPSDDKLFCPVTNAHDHHEIRCRWGQLLYIVLLTKNEKL